MPRTATVGQCHSLLRLVAIPSEENLPLVPLVENWAEDERGVQRSRLRKLGRLLKSGSTLADAVEQIPGSLRADDVLAIRFDAQMGTRATSIRRMLNRSSDGEANYVQRVRGDFLYAATVLFVGLVIVGFVQLRIIPVGLSFLNSKIKYSQIYDGSSQTILVGEALTTPERLGWVSGTRATLRNTSLIETNQPYLGTVQAKNDEKEKSASLFVGGFGSHHPSQWRQFWIW